MTNAIYFDMDGTVYDLYSIEGWLDMLHNEDTAAYSMGRACIDMERLNAVLETAIALGIVVGVITWSAMGGSKEYNKAVRKVKREWVKENMPCVSEFHCVKYGTPKHKVAKVKPSILVDDNAEVRKAWKNGDTINACEDIVEQIEYYLTTITA